MKLFAALVHKDADSAFGIAFPDLPGCFAAAEDSETIVENAAEALALWFEDQPGAAPRPLDAVRDAVAGDLAEGAFLVAVPYVRPTTKTRRVNLSLPVGTVDAIDAAARAHRLSRSAFVEMAAMNQIGAGRAYRGGEGRGRKS